jgi:integrase/recombinase XerD
MYLQQRKYAVGTIGHYYNYVGMFLQWLESEQIEVETINYQNLKHFIFLLRNGSGGQVQLKKEKRIGFINRVFIALDHYYKCLDIGYNPVGGIKLRGSDRNMKNYFIKYENLETLYRLHSELDDRSRRNKVLLGIMIYQGIASGTLHQLQPKHINLREAKIFIPGSNQSNRRVLTLQANQLMPLQNYLEEIRPRLLEAIKSGAIQFQSARKVNQIQEEVYEQLFFSINGSRSLKNSLVHLFKNVQKVYPRITSVKAIRSTVITNWLKQYDIRQVQYMAGHKFVSSTEKYNAFNLEDLEESMRNFHPLK